MLLADSDVPAGVGDFCELQGETVDEGPLRKPSTIHVAVPEHCHGGCLRLGHLPLVQRTPEPGGGPRGAQVAGDGLAVCVPDWLLRLGQADDVRILPPDLRRDLAGGDVHEAFGFHPALEDGGLHPRWPVLPRFRQPDPVGPRLHDVPELQEGKRSGRRGRRSRRRRGGEARLSKGQRQVPRLHWPPVSPERGGLAGLDLVHLARFGG
mmetsp:Transcript_64613/g.171735  ORF Transcript_64613/g.171735 Transcript_64613/m.171735 type:complete len:208 (+) Transcript_64613:493-1116(+)